MVNDHFFDFSSEEMLSRRFAGKLLLRKEIPLSDHHFKQLLLRDQFKSMLAIVKNKFSYTCQRCHNSKLSLFANISCYRSQITHLYFLKCIHMTEIYCYLEIYCVTYVKCLIFIVKTVFICDESCRVRHYIIGRVKSLHGHALMTRALGKVHLGKINKKLQTNS